MDPELNKKSDADKPPDPARKLVRIKAQRFKFGSLETNTVSTPPPCYIHHLLVREEWPDAKSQSPEKLDDHRDPVEIAKDIRKAQKALDDANNELDIAVLDEQDVEDDLSKGSIKKKIVSIQGEIIDLEIERITAQSQISPYKPPTGIREFVIVREVPPKIQDIINDAEARLEPLRFKLNRTYDEWLQAHNLHEEVKIKLKAFNKEKQKKATARDDARMKYELARRLQSTRRAEADSGSGERALKLKQFLKLDAQSKAAKADKGEAAALGEFMQTRQEYQDYCSTFDVLKREEKDRYKALVAKLTEIRDITREMGAIEAEAQEARNILKSGSTIEMIAFEETEYWKKKSPTVTIEPDSKTAVFDEEKHLCGDLIPKRNDKHWDPQLKRQVSHVHPHIHIEAPASGWHQHNRLGGNKKFQIFETYLGSIPRSSFTQKAKKGPFKGRESKTESKMPLSGLATILEHILSAFPIARTYRILAETCGFTTKALRVTDKLNATLKVFPADVYKIEIKSQAGFGYEKTHEEKVSDTTKIAGAADESGAGNAAGNQQIDVTDSESWSRMGVVQSSNSRTVTSDEHGRSITTVTTVTRDGVFGNATTTDVMGGKLAGGISGEGVDYSGTMVRTQETGGYEKVVSLSERFDGEDFTKQVDSEGVVTENESDSSGLGAGARSARLPSVPPGFMPQIPIDIILSRNGVEDPITEDLRKTIGLLIYIIRRSGDIISRIGNILPSAGWKFGFNMSLLTGAFSYEHDWREHVNHKVWLHHKFDLDLNIITAKIFVFGGASADWFILQFQIGLEVYIQGLIGVKGSFEKTHPDADKGWDLGFGPTGSIGIGAEAKAIVGQPDWFRATGTIETGIELEATWWLRKAGEKSPFLEFDLKWQGVTLKGVLHIILVGHWEKEIPLCEERHIGGGRFPKAEKPEVIKKMLEGQNDELAKSLAKREKKAAEREKQLEKQNKKLAKMRR